MPDMALNSLSEGWRQRCTDTTFGNLKVTIPSVSDLLAPKLQRNEPRDIAQARYMVELGLYEFER